MATAAVEQSKMDPPRYKSFKYVDTPVLDYWKFCDSREAMRSYPGRVLDSIFGNSKADPLTRKKFRKMRHTFDAVMHQSNALFMEEQDAIKTSKRLAQENE